MNKQEAGNLMIGSFVMINNELKKVCCITSRKIGVAKGDCGHRDFYRFDQVQGIPLTDKLLESAFAVRVFPNKFGYVIGSALGYLMPEADGQYGLYMQTLGKLNLITRIKFVHQLQLLFNGLGLYYEKNKCERLWKGTL